MALHMRYASKERHKEGSGATDIDTRICLPAKVPCVLVGLAIAATVLVFAILLLAPAGRLDWTIGWLYMSIITVSVTVNWACLRRWNPELVAHRMRFGARTKTWDKVWAALFAPVMIAVYVVAGFEARAGVSSTVGTAWWLGLTIFIPGWAMLTWSMVVKPFFEKTVRIQTERGHRVIDTGPYAYVRHPGYLGFVGWIVSAPRCSIRRGRSSQRCSRWPGS